MYCRPQRKPVPSRNLAFLHPASAFAGTNGPVIEGPQVILMKPSSSRPRVVDISKSSFFVAFIGWVLLRILQVADGKIYKEWEGCSAVADAYTEVPVRGCLGSGALAGVSVGGKAVERGRLRRTMNAIAAARQISPATQVLTRSPRIRFA